MTTLDIIKLWDNGDGIGYYGPLLNSLLGEQGDVLVRDKSGAFSTVYKWGEGGPVREIFTDRTNNWPIPTDMWCHIRPQDRDGDMPVDLPFKEYHG